MAKRTRKHTMLPDAPDILAGGLHIPTGNTMLNLACSGDYTYAWLTGTMVNEVGDSRTGKSFQAMNMCAELALDPQFDNYDFYYDDVEHAVHFDLVKLFGKRLSERLQPAHGFNSDGEPVYSETVEDFRNRIYHLLEGDRPIIYVLDSFDALGTEAERKRVEAEIRKKNRASSDDDEKAKGSYGVEKPKLASQLFRLITRKLEETNSFLLVISQTRADIGFSFATDPKTRSGGEAFKFYAFHEFWMSEGDAKIQKTVKGKAYSIGNVTAVKVTKNRINGKLRRVKFITYPDYGIDDIGSCLQYLIDVGYIGKGETDDNEEETGKRKVKRTTRSKTAKYSLPDLEIEGTFDSIVRQIEDGGLEDDLRQMVQTAWDEIEMALCQNRKPRYE